MPVSKALAFEAEFLSYVRTQQPATLEAINASGTMSGDDEQVLTDAMKSFKASYNYAA